MKIFVDAKVLVAILNKEYPLFSYASRILSFTDKKNFQGFASPICLAIAFYFAIESDCQTLVTEDKGDFHFSEIEVFSCREFMEKYL